MIIGAWNEVSQAERDKDVRCFRAYTAGYKYVDRPDTVVEKQNSSKVNFKQLPKEVRTVNAKEFAREMPERSLFRQSPGPRLADCFLFSQCRLRSRPFLCLLFGQISRH